MITFIGNMTTEEIIEISGLHFDISDNEKTEKFLLALEANHGVSKDDICLFQCPSDSEEYERFNAGDSYDVVWENSAISGLDFTPEDTKKRFLITVSETEIEEGETVDITVSLFDSDATTPLTNVNKTLRMPIQTPFGQSKVKMNFVNGVATKTITLKNAGVYTIGANHNEGAKSIGTLPTIEVVM